MSVMHSEAVYYFPIDGRFAPGGTSHSRKMGQHWMAGAPYVALAMIPFDRERKPGYGIGVCALADEAEELKLPVEDAVFLPAGQCVLAWFQGPMWVPEPGEKTVPQFIQEIYGWMDENGWEQDGEMLSVLQLSMGTMEKRRGFNTIRIPVKKINKIENIS